MDVLARIRQRAADANTHIVLPEGEDDRTIRAASLIRAQSIARVTLIGNEASIRDRAATLGVSLGDTPIVDPKTSPKLEDYARVFYERRRSKGVTLDEARRSRRDPLYFGNLMVRSGDADGSVAVSDERDRKVCFTGFVAGGKRIMAMAAPTLTRGIREFMDTHSVGFPP